jgi:hypothetical protein
VRGHQPLRRGAGRDQRRSSVAASHPVGYEVTLTAKYDDDAKTAMRFFFGGPGWKALLADMGFTTVPPADN